MVYIKKVKTGGGSRPATPPHLNRIMAASEVSREQNVYVTTKIDITPGVDASTELRIGYHKLILTHKEKATRHVFFFQRDLSPWEAL